MRNFSEQPVLATNQMLSDRLCSPLIQVGEQYKEKRKLTSLDSQHSKYGQDSAAPK
jgi:hypothetical protein